MIQEQRVNDNYINRHTFQEYDTWSFSTNNTEH